MTQGHPMVYRFYEKYINLAGLLTWHFRKFVLYYTISIERGMEYMVQAEFEFRLNGGQGQGFYENLNFPGLNALVIVRNEHCSPVRLVITRYDADTVSFDVPANSDFGVELSHIQTVGILNLGNRQAKGDITIIPNFSQSNIS